MSNKKTTEQFKKEVKELEGDGYTVLGEYINNKAKIKMRHNCEACGNHEYEVRPNDFLQGYRCPACGKTKKQTNAQFIKRVSEKYGNDYTILTEYTSSNTNIVVKHNSDNCNYHEFETTPNKFLNQGQGCPVCYKKRNRTTEWFKNEVSNQVGNEYEVIGEFTSTNHKVKFRHNCEKCKNHEFEMVASCFIDKKQRCPKCSGRMRKTTEIFKDDVLERVNQEYTVLGEYKNNSTKIKMKHNTCGHEYEVPPKSFLRGDRCPKCARNNSESKNSVLIKNYLDEKAIPYEIEYKFDDKTIQNKPFDFLITVNGENLLLEYDGKQHFKKSFGESQDEFEKQLESDIIKDKFCMENNIKLVRIPYTLTEEEIVSVMDELMHNNTEKINNCLIIEGMEYVKLPEIYKTCRQIGSDR